MRLYVFIVFCISVFGCKTHLKAQENPSKIEKSFLKVKIKSGTQEATFLKKSGEKYKARITFPENLQDQARHELIIALHWAGDFGTYKEFNDCLVVPGFKNLEAIIVSPEGETQLWNTKNNVEKVLSIIENSQKFWNVNPKKIAIMGYSNGGNGSWYFAEKHPELFSAAIPMAGLYRITEQIDVPIYAIQGAQDELFPLKKSRHWVEKTKDAGSDVTFVVNEKLSHFQGCSYIEELDKASEWLKNIWKEK